MHYGNFFLVQSIVRILLIQNHLKNEPFKFEIINLQILYLWCRLYVECLTGVLTRRLEISLYKEFNTGIKRIP